MAGIKNRDNQPEIIPVAAVSNCTPQFPLKSIRFQESERNC